VIATLKRRLRIHKEKAEDVFYDPKIRELIDEVYTTVNRVKLIKTLTIAKSAIRHNMAKDLPKMRANLYYGEE
jgi:hypothetical protein